jgi:hypothetical protein
MTENHVWPDDPGRWWPVVRSEDLGVTVDLGNRKQFLFQQDVEVREDPLADPLL